MSDERASAGSHWAPVLGLLLITGAGCSNGAGPRWLSLSGNWEARAGSADETYDASVSADDGWRSVSIPCRQWPQPALNHAPVVWARRALDIGPDTGGLDAVLHWGRVLWGAKAWVNGTPVGESPVTCPHDVLLPSGTLQPGENTIVIRVGGWSGIPKHGDIPLVPGGFPNWGGDPASSIFGDVWLDLYRQAYLSHIIMVSDVPDGSVTARVHSRASVLPLRDLSRRGLCPGRTSTGDTGYRR